MSRPLRWLRDGKLPLLAARLALGAVFLAFGLHKVLHPVAFLKALREYDVLPLAPPLWLNLTAVLLPWVEVVAAALLLAGAFVRATGALLLVVTALFTAAVAARAADLAQGLGVGLCDVAFDCGCGQGVVPFCGKLLENAGLMALAALVACSRSRFLALEARWGAAGGGFRWRRPRRATPSPSA